MFGKIVDGLNFGETWPVVGWHGDDFVVATFAPVFNMPMVRRDYTAGNVDSTSKHTSMASPSSEWVCE